MEDEALRQVVLAAEEHPANAGVHKAIPAQKAFTILYHEDHHYLHRLPRQPLCACGIGRI